MSAARADIWSNDRRWHVARLRHIRLAASPRFSHDALVRLALCNAEERARHENEARPFTARDGVGPFAHHTGPW